MLRDVREGAWINYLAVSVLSISTVSLVLLVLDAFRPKQALLLGLGFSALIFYISKKRSSLVAAASGFGLLPLLALLFLAAVFRVEPFPWINGGQDQGVYVSMSSYYQRGGGVFIEDTTLSKISDRDFMDVYKSNRREGAFHPGVYYGGERDYVFQFYHLHPLWMSLFADVFGDGARVYSLTFFSLLSILFLTLLTFELSGSRLAACSVGVLLALNPLHVFFSKWPVTEVVALAFSSMALYYLTVAHRLHKESISHARWMLAISCISMSMIFFVRITGFLYIPFIFGVFVLGGWLKVIVGEYFGRDLEIFSAACIVFYLLSVMYGLRFSPIYSVDIYGVTFGKLTSFSWQVTMTFLLAVLICVMVAWRLFLQRAKVGLKVLGNFLPGNMLLVFILLVTLFAAVSFFRVYQIGYTDVHATHPWWGKRWQFSGAGFSVVTASSVLGWLFYSSPLLLFAGLIGLRRNGCDWRLVALSLIPFASLCAFFVQTPIIPYQYYYARYLLSEGVPYAIVIAVVAMFVDGASRWRAIAAAVIFISVACFLIFSIKQFGAEEGKRPLNVLQRIAANIDPGDALLIEPQGWSIPRFGVETPLRFYFNLHTIAISSGERKEYENIVSHDFRKIWLLSPVEIDDRDYIFRDRFLHQDRVMERSAVVPTKVVDNFWRQELFLYELKSSGWPSGGEFTLEFDYKRYSMERNKLAVSKLLGIGWHAVESSHVWSSAESELILSKSLFAKGELPESILIEFVPYAASQNRPVSLQINACGDFTETVVYQSSELQTLRIPIMAPHQETCDVNFAIRNAVSPVALGQSRDSRILGISFRAVTFER